jgi:hypothetical protein
MLITKILKDPLAHFLLIGFVLFIVYGFLNNEASVATNTIVVSQGDLDLLVAQARKRLGRPPVIDEKQQLLDAFIREQILYREALSLGLDQNDQIVRRRLAQKLEFLFSDLVPVPEPGDNELDLFLEENEQQFIIPQKISFQQVFLTENDRVMARERSESIAKELNENTESDPEGLSDRAWFPTDFVRVTQRKVSADFGPDFAEQVFSLSPSGWAGSIESSMGVHVVRVESVSPAILPSLENIRESVAAEWRRQKEFELREVFMESLRRKYEVDLSSVSLDSS